MENSELLSSFLQEAQEVMTALETGVSALHTTDSTEHDPDHMGRLGVLAHRLKGSAGLYGFPQLSKMAALLERILDSRPELSGHERHLYLNLLDTSNTVLERGLARIVAGELESDLGLAFTRMGGAGQLQELLRLSPDAFKPRPSSHLLHHEEHDALLHGTTQEMSEAEQVSVEDSLRQFVQENAEVWEYFAPEIREHLGGLSNQLNQDAPDLDVMFRAAHTIKGSSFMVGLSALGDFAHCTEDLLGAVRDGTVRLDTPVREVLNAAVDNMERLMQVADGAQHELTGPLEAVRQKLVALASGEKEAVAPATTQAGEANTNLAVTDASVAQTSAPENASIRVPSRQLEALMEQMAELVTARARLGRTLSRLDELQNAMLESQQRFQRTVRDFEERHLNPDMVRGTEGDGTVPDGAPGGSASGAGMQGTDLTQQFDELEFDTYNDLNILARSITELSADFAEVRRRLSDSVIELHDENDQLGKLLRRLRLDVSQTSRVGFTQVTGRLKRWAREHAERFEFIIDGDETRADSAVLQRLGEPLLHLLNNALHHGLGSAEQRLATGKPARGKVWLRAEQRANFLDVTVEDDGMGLNLENIRSRALERGLRSAQELSSMTPDELSRLILLPGLSTAEQVNTMVGRGVGMDVVATTTRQLGGELLIRTTPGQGTAITLRLPTSRRIMDILQVKVAEQPLAFAISSIRALRELSMEDLGIGEQGFEVPFEGKDLPILDLREMWGAAGNSDTYLIVVLSSMSGDVAVRVDEFGRIEESSVTPPSPLLSKLEYLSGTALSASGEVLPILDPLGLTRLAKNPDAWLKRQAQTAATTKQARLLLVDDSLSVRRVVSRMLERGGWQVETANDGQHALEMLQADPNFDAVISDLEMPRMNGYEFLTAARARSSTANLPVMIMTTRAGEKHQRLAFQLGAQDYFTKPVNEALLLRRIGTILAGAPVNTAPLGGGSAGNNPGVHP